MHCSNIRPLLIWITVQWCGQIKTWGGEMQLAENGAARLAVSCNRRTNIIRVLRTSGWSLVRDRMVIFIFKIQNVPCLALLYSSNGHRNMLHISYSQTVFETSLKKYLMEQNSSLSPHQAGFHM